MAEKKIKIVSYGGGINSTAMIIYMINNGYNIDYILFSDTGGEKPHTYNYINYFNEWLIKHDLYITIVKRHDKYNSLEDECIKTKSLPSIAYGRFKSCSDKWKIQPQKKFINSILKKDQKYINYIGFTADEWKRVKYIDHVKYENKFPLFDNDIDQDGCVEIINKSGLDLPKKSSCFFCPNSRNNEIIDLYENYPNLYKRCIDIENNADLTNIKGLKRDKSFSDIIHAYKSQLNLFEDVNENNYGCICE